MRSWKIDQHTILIAAPDSKKSIKNVQNLQINEDNALSQSVIAESIREILIKDEHCFFYTTDKGFLYLQDIRNQE